MLEPTPIDPAEFSAALLRETARLGVDLPGLQVLDETSSTNQVAWELAKTGAPAGTIVIALQQSAGRGQWGRQWSSPLGGLYLSRYFEPQLPPEDGAQLTLAAAWGLGQTLRDRAVPVEIKWPNDLVVRGRKWGGLLTETRLAGGLIGRAVTGLGLNWINPVPETGISAIDLFADDPAPAVRSLPALAALAIAGLTRGEQQRQTGGIESLLADYLELLETRNRPVQVGERSGIAVGVTSRGELRVKLSGAIAEELHLAPGSIRLGYARRPPV
ncbi:MAG: biotin--[acetyl-CoA-carboxylase] ligase [Oscillatoriales cyanobacterium]|nr:MAG: biotin--[acetyl-CoA-carboxylase] ligase [Oscillatoriales cyanobacterium]